MAPYRKTFAIRLLTRLTLRTSDLLLRQLQPNAGDKSGAAEKEMEVVLVLSGRNETNVDLPPFLRSSCLGRQLLTATRKYPTLSGCCVNGGHQLAENKRTCFPLPNVVYAVQAYYLPGQPTKHHFTPTASRLKSLSQRCLLV
jgi:hypothetical protein